jgi:hypothetical protein
VTTLAEDLLPVSLDDDGHPRDPGSALGYAVAGGIIAELLLGGRIVLDPGKKVQVAGIGDSTGDAVLDAALERIRAEDKPRKVKWWVQKVAGGGWRNDVARNEVIEDLTADGVLTRQTGKVLGMFKVATHPPADPAAPERPRAAVREVLIGGAAPDERTAALVGLVNAAGLVDACVEKADRKAARARAKEIAKGEHVSDAVKALQEEVMAAVMVAITASSVAASSGSN